MTVNTVIDFGRPRSAQLKPTSSRPRPTVVNLSGDAMHQHEKIMEYRRKVSKLNADLEASMATLESANADIERLNSDLKSALEAVASANAEIDRLNGVIADLKRDKGSGTPHKKAKQQKVQAQKPDAEPETPADPPAGLFEASSK